MKISQNTSFLYLLAIGCFCLACNTGNKKPEQIWSDERFAEVLTEVQVAESIIRLGYQNKKDSSIVGDSIFNAAFRLMNTTRVEFDSNYNYYLDRPEELEKIYEIVITKLSERSAELNKKK